MNLPSAPVSNREPQQFSVLLFAGLRDAVQCERITVSISTGQQCLTVTDLLRACSEQFPPLTPWLPHVRVAVNLEYSGLDTPLRRGDEIALIPPVAGG